MKTQIKPLAGNPRPPRRRGTRIVGAMILLVMLVVGGYVAYILYPRIAGVIGQNGAPPAGGRPANRPAVVVTAQARLGDLPIYLNALGTVSAYNIVTVRTRIDGELVKVNFTEGQQVKKEDILFQIDPRPYQQVLNQANGKLAQDMASLENARADLKRYQDAGNAVTRQQTDTAAAQVRQFEGLTEIDNSAIEAAKLNIAYCTIAAPIDGTIGLRMVDQGNMVHSSDSAGLAVITQLQPIAAYFYLGQDFLPSIMKARAAGDVPAEAWDRDLKTKLAVGKLLALDNQIDPTTATIKLKAEFQNADLKLYPNEFVNIKLLVDIRKDIVLVNSAALQRSGDQVFVYLVKPAPATQSATQPASAPATVHGSATQRAAMPESIVEQRIVKTGPSDTIITPNGTAVNVTVIEEGLAPGDVVVTDGVDKLIEGARVYASSGTAQSGARAGRGVTPSGGAASQPGTRGSGGRRGGAEAATGTEPAGTP